MARVRSPNRDKAYEIYKLNSGEILLKDIAAQLGIKDTQVRKWKSQDKWEQKLKGTLPINKSNVTNECDNKKISKCSKEADFINSKNDTNKDIIITKKTNSTNLGGAPKGNKNALGNKGGNGGPVGNKKAVTTGEFETIFFDTLDKEELNLVDKTPFEKMDLLKQEIQLLTVRERRMLKRIEVLKEKDMTIVYLKSGTEKGMDTELNEYEGTLGQIQNIEEALTRVQDKKQKAIDTLHKFEIDEQRLELSVMKLELEIMKQGGQDEEVEDDGFMDALKSEVGDTWDD